MVQHSIDWQAIEKQYYVQCFGRAPITIVKGEGTKVWDDTGREYLDFVAGIAVNALGHSNPQIADAIATQARTLVQTSSLYYTTPQLEVAQQLIDNSDMDRIFFTNSGGESTETAVKAARKHGKTSLDDAFEVITTDRSFHGRTLAMTAATGTPAYQDPFRPMPEGFRQVSFNDIDAMSDAISSKTCAIMIEPVQAEGGIYPATLDYLQQLRKLCDQNNLLLIFDEVQTGIGRLGHFLGYQHFGVQPDIIALAKGLGGGVPIGATLFKEHASTLQPGDHGNTFGGNPLACAAAKVVVETILQPGFLQSVSKKSDLLIDGLEKLKQTGQIVDVRGLGLLVGFELSSPDLADKVVNSCRDDGLILVKVSASTIRMVPPLTVEASEIEAAIGIVSSALH
tara:strand:- start:1131 stop:2318 length:1188 start_codon:yes stop_codon:yes gene_type:complete